MYMYTYLTWLSIYPLPTLTHSPSIHLSTIRHSFWWSTSSTYGNNQRQHRRCAVRNRHESIRKSTGRQFQSTYPANSKSKRYTKKNEWEWLELFCSPTTPFQLIVSTNLLNAPSQPTISTYPLNTPFQQVWYLQCHRYLSNGFSIRWRCVFTT